MNHRVLVFLMVICSGLGGILYGYDIGVISGALLFIRKTIPMNDFQIGIIVGAVLGGGFIANLITGSLADLFGRRTMIIIASLVFIIGIVAILETQSFVWLLVSRLILGIGVGIVSVAVPLYLSEVAPTRVRGMSVTVFQLFLTFGIVLAYFVDLLFTPSGNWHGMFAVLFIPSLLLLIAMLYLPESPRWLVANKKNDQAKNVLSRTRPHFEAQIELEAIHDSLTQSKSSWGELFSAKLILPLFIAMFIAASNQLTGINSILQYAPLIIKKAGIHSHTLLMKDTVVIGLVQFITCILALFLIDKVGRKALLIIGTGGLIVADTFLALVAHSHISLHLQGVFQLAGLIAWIIFYAIGPGVVVWLVFAELLPTRVRGRGVALCLFFNSLCSAVLSSVFLPIIDHIGMANTYWLLGFFTLLYFLVAVFLLPETKGKSLEEIQSYFENKTKIYKEVVSAT